MRRRNLIVVLGCVVACARGVSDGDEPLAVPDKTAKPHTPSTGAGPSAHAVNAASSVASTGGNGGSGGNGGAANSVGMGGAVGTGGSSGSCDVTSCQSCTTCASSAGCSAEYLACVGNFQCNAYAACVQNCTDPACTQTCQTLYPLGVMPYDAYATCLCSECPTTCSGECA